MVGEIRDPETATIAIQASMTGHLVLSTLHTNDAPSAGGRLLDMGIEPYLITSSLTMVVAQRLARVPCPRCAEPTDANPRRLELLGLDPSLVDPDKLLHGPDCGACSQTGYQGRIGLFEVLTVTRCMRELVVERAPEGALRDEAVAAGMRSMRTDGSTRPWPAAPPAEQGRAGGNAWPNAPRRVRTRRGRPTGTRPGLPGSQPAEPLRSTAPRP